MKRSYTQQRLRKYLGRRGKMDFRASNKNWFSADILPKPERFIATKPH